MSTEVTWRAESTSLEQSYQIAAMLANRLKGGEVIELSSDLGGGKTTFVKGIVKGLGSGEHVSSPSFTISNQYQVNDFTIYHYDFYRLGDAGLMSQELADSLTDPNGIVIVEWAGAVENVLPASRLKIAITATGETDRVFAFTAPEGLNYLQKGDA